MSVNVVLNGTTYTIPEPGDSDWGQNLTDYFVAQATGLLQKSGGSFTLTAEVDFGATYGLKSAYFKSRTASAASAGTVRLARPDVIDWRNNAGDGNLALGVDTSNRLTFNGNPIIPSTALTASRAVVTDSSGVLSTSSVTSTQIGYLSGASGTTGTTSLVYNTSPTLSGTVGGTLTFSGAMTLSASGNALVVNRDVATGQSVPGTASVLIGTPSNAGDYSSLINLQNSNSQKNWQISTNRFDSGALEFTPSTAGGGSTYTTPAMSLTNAGKLSIATTTDSSSTSTGAVVTAGGVGIAKALFVGTTLSVTGVATFTAAPVFSSATASNIMATDSGKALTSLTYASANTASAMVQRDSSGNFSAGTITAALTGTASGNTTYTANQYGVVLSGSANAMVVLAPDSSTTKVLTCGGASANPSWQTVTADLGFTLLGDTLYGGASGVATVLAGNTTSTKKFLRQTGTGAVSAAPAWDTLVAGDIPNLAASIITSGQLALARGGTNADLSATGGTSQVLKQATSGAAITVAQLAFTDISGSVAAGQMPALTGDITTSAGAVATTLATTIANVHTFSGAITLSAAGTALTVNNNATITGTSLLTGVATFTAAPVFSSASASQAMFTDGSKGLVSNAITGSGNVVMSASPTLTGTITAAIANFSGNVTHSADSTFGGAGSSAGVTKLSLNGTSAVVITGATTGGGTTGGGTASFSLGSGQDGLFIVSNASIGALAFGAISGGSASVSIFNDPSSKFSTTATTASKDNITLSGGSLTVEHNSSSSSNSFRVMFFRTD